MPRRQGVAALCAKNSVGGPGLQISGILTEPSEPRQQPDGTGDPNVGGSMPAAAAAASASPSPAAKGAGAKRTRRTPTSGRKRRSRGEDPPQDAGAAAGAAAEEPAPGPSSSAADASNAADGKEPLPAQGAAAAAAATTAVMTAVAAAAATPAVPGGASSDATEQKDQQQQPQQQPQQQQAEAPGSRTPSPGAEDEPGLTPTQRATIAANRNRALARRAVAEASAPGAPPLQLSSLLVEPSWREALAGELEGPTLRQLEVFLRTEWAPSRKPVFPPKDCIFQAFNACPFDKVRVVILGQDPYHGPGQAMGLSFSVPREVRPLPPSLLNIYKEAAADLGWADRPQQGDLSAWSVQGVLLLNTCLTVRQGEANSHAKRGWEQFTDSAIRVLSARRTGLVFLLWGNPAQAKAGLVDTRKHHVLKAAHPSPLSASRGFFGCRHFSQTNKLLTAQGLEPIEWRPN